MDAYKFIFEDYLESREEGGYDYSYEKFEKSLKSYLKTYRTNYLLFKCHDLLKRRNRYKSYDILFVGTKMMDFVNAASDEFKCGVIVRGKRSRNELNQHNCDTIFGDYWINRLYKAALNKNREREVEEIIDSIVIWLKELDPNYIILFSNTGFFERAIVAAARKHKISTIKMQHGMMHHNEGDFKISNVSDYIWVWSNYFKELILSNLDIEPERIKVFGYPHEVISKKWPDEVKKVCFLGQQDGNSEPTPEQKYEVVSKIKEDCNNAGLEFFYRPHPTERKAKYKFIIDHLENMDVQITSKEETLKDAFSKYDMFISFFSTALIDAYMNKRYCLQILMNWERKVDNFQQMGVGTTIRFEDLSSIQEYVQISEKIQNSNNDDFASLKQRIKNSLTSI